MNLLIERHQWILARSRRNILSVRQLTEFFDDLINFLNANVSNRVDSYRLITTVCFDFTGVHHLGLFNRLKILKHPFFSLLSRTFEMLFTKLLTIWLTPEENQCLDAISLFIKNLCLHKNEILTNFYIANNEKFDPETPKKSPWISYDKIFFTETFRVKFRSMLEKDFPTNRIDPSENFKYQLADRFLRLWMKLNQTDYQFLLNGIVQCLKSEIYFETARNVDLRQSFLSPKESFFLYQCPKFVRTMFFNQQEKISQLLCGHFVEQSEKIFKKQLPIACEGEFVSKEKSIDGREKVRGAKIQSISWHIELLNFFALVPSSRFEFIKSSFENVFTGNEQTTMVDQMIKILQTESLIKSVQVNRSFYHADVSLVAYSLVLIYNLVFEMKIFRYLKDRKPLEVLEKLSQAKDKTIEFTSTTLKAILEKEKIDQIEHPTSIARSYLYMIENTIDEVSHIFHGIKLEGVLTNLETVVQNDDVKEEIVNDDGLSLLGECSYRSDLDFQTIRFPALRIIETISFASQASERLVQNERLMDHLNNLSRSTDQMQSPISKRILWIAEKEEKFINEQTTTNNVKTISSTEEIFPLKEFDEKNAIYQYVSGDYRFRLDRRYAGRKSDVLLNFSRFDRDLAQKISEQLKSTNLYEVLLLEVNDDDPQAMAQIIENTSIVIICCSNEYRHSNASRLEATFAKKRQKILIGLKTERKYEINGWLRNIFQTDKLIDFSKIDFNSSIKELRLQIEILKK